MSVILDTYIYDDLDYQVELKQIIVSFCGETSCYDQEDEDYRSTFQSNAGRGGI